MLRVSTGQGTHRETILPQRCLSDSDRRRAGVLRPAPDQPWHEDKTPSYNEFLQQVENGQVAEVTFNTKDNSLDVKETNGDTYDQAFLDSDSAQAELLNTLEQKNVKTEIKDKGGSSILSLLTYILPFLLFFAFWIFLMNQMQGGGSRVMSFGKSRAKRMSVDARRSPSGTLPGPTRRSRSSTRSRSSSRTRRSSSPSAPGSRRACCSTAPRHRQDAARPRRRR